MNQFHHPAGIAEVWLLILLKVSYTHLNELSISVGTNFPAILLCLKNTSQSCKHVSFLFLSLLFYYFFFFFFLFFFFFSFLVFTSVLMCIAFQPIIASSCHKMTSDSLSSTLLLSALLLTTKLLTHATPMGSHNDTGSFLNDVLRQVSQVQLEVNILKGTRASIKSK